MKEEEYDYMSRPQAVHCLMDMMKTAKDEFEVEALALACRSLLKRWKDRSTRNARRRLYRNIKV